MEMMTTALGSVPTTEIHTAWKPSRSSGTRRSSVRARGLSACMYVQEPGGGTSARIRSSCLSFRGRKRKDGESMIMGAANPVQAQPTNPGGNPVPGFDLRDLSPLGPGSLANGVA